MEKTYRKGTKVRVERDAHDVVRVDVPRLRIISEDLWAAAHAQMRAKKPASGELGERKKGGRPATYLLSGLTKCSVCGGALTVIGGRDGTKPIKVYACSYRHDRGDPVCTNSHRRPVERVNAGVVDWIKSNILSDELVLDTLKEVRKRLTHRRGRRGHAAHRRPRRAFAAKASARSRRHDDRMQSLLTHREHELLTAKVDLRANAPRCAT